MTVAGAAADDAGAVLIEPGTHMFALATTREGTFRSRSAG
jgi:hypothetical protein